MDQRHDAYVKYLPATSVHNTLGHSIGGSFMHLHGRIEDEIAVLGVYLAQDGAVYSADDRVLFWFNKGNGQQFLI